MAIFTAKIGNNMNFNVDRSFQKLRAQGQYNWFGFGLDSVKNGVDHSI